MRIFDAQIRTDSRSDDDLKNLAYFGTERVVTTPGEARAFGTSDELLSYFRSLCVEEVARLRRCGLSPFVSLGVLPNARPKRSHYEVWRELPSLLLAPEVVAVGEIGAWNDVSREWDAFERQLKMAMEANLPVLITPPTDLYVNMTYKMLRRVTRVGIPHDRVMVTRTDHRIATTLLAEGFVAGLSAGAGALDPRGAAKLLVELAAERGNVSRLMLMSSLQEGPADVLSVPKVLAELPDAWSETDLAAVVWNNACEFYDRHDSTD